MKNSIAMFVTLLMTSAALAGPFVSEGTGPTGTYLRCAGSKKESLEIRGTAAVTYIQGLYTDAGGGFVNTACKLNQKQWQCRETREGEGLLLVSTEIMSQGKIIARISRQDIFGHPQLMSILTCKK